MLVLRLAAGRAPAPWVSWVMYTLGLVACPVGLGSRFSGSAVAPAGFIRTWVKRGLRLTASPRSCLAGCNFLVAVCAGGPLPSGGAGLLTGVPWPLARAWRAGVALPHGCGTVSFLSGL